MARVGVTASSTAEAAEYRRAVEAAGAESYVFVNDVARLAEQLDACDGVLLTGGLDVDPARYGAQPHPATKPAKPPRDAFEIALVRAARERKLPLLAICRGLQIANVAFGGTLLQDIPSELGTRIPHALETGGKRVKAVLATHVVAVESDCALAAIVGATRFATSSRHHQAVDVVAPELRAVAATPDGVVEALEARWPSPFWLAVQWHPESTLDDGGVSRAIFARFVRAAESGSPAR